MIKYGDTQKKLADALGMSLSRFNAKLNQTHGAEFRQTEISYIKKRYHLSAKEISNIFLLAEYLFKLHKIKKTG